MEIMCLCWPGDNSFHIAGGEGMAGGGGDCSLQAVPKVESSARAPRLPRFIQLVSFSVTLLVISILDIVYECHLRPFLQF